MLRRAAVLSLAACAVGIENSSAPVAGTGAVGLKPAFPAVWKLPTAPVGAASTAAGPVALVAPSHAAAPAALFDGPTLASYKAMLTRIIAWKRWRMGYFYLFSTKYSAYVSAMPAELSDEMAKVKVFLSKSAIFFDILANYEITGFIYCVLLRTWAGPPPTDYMSSVSFYQNVKLVYSFWTWQYLLIMKDYMALFPEAWSKVDPKFKTFVEVGENYACFHAFNEWHVAKMMGMSSLNDPTAPITQASIASFFWDESFIKTVKTLTIFKMWSWHYTDVAWLKTVPPYIALALPYIAFFESYWEWALAGLQEESSKAVAMATKIQVAEH